MPWHEIPTVDSLWQLLGAVQTTDPSSLELALVGIVTFLCYQILARSDHERRGVGKRERSIAKPQAAAPVTEDRLVA